ncbi:MAG: hypothetical protein CTY39_09220 [Hyphomicrobium sp.]|nr:MAG: hypothetical protein CTY39_09220 [Hyphomicrobium sp.]
MAARTAAERQKGGCSTLWRQPARIARSGRPFEMGQACCRQRHCGSATATGRPRVAGIRRCRVPALGITDRACDRRTGFV